MQIRFFRTTLLTIAILSLLPACTMIKLKKDTDALEQMGQIGGSVILDSLTLKELHNGEGQLILGLFKGGFDAEDLVDIQVSVDGKFNFYAFPGKYHLAVTHDKNGDFSAQAGESVGFSPLIITLTAKQVIENIELTISAVYDEEQAAKQREREKKSLYTNLWKGIHNIGTIVSLDDSRFSDENAHKALWQPLTFSSEVGPGVYFLEDYDPNKIPILLVHGIGGSPRNWESHVNQIDRDKFQPWLFQYETGFPLTYSSFYLYEAMKELKRLYKFEKVYLIAHSMGGLVSKAYVDLTQKNNEDYLKLFVTLATPWGGHNAARIGTKFAPVTIPVWHDMQPESPFLERLWMNPLPPSIDYYLLFSYRGGSVLTPGCDDGAVSLHSQLNPNAQNQARKVTGFYVNHNEILVSEEVFMLLSEYTN